MAGPVPKHPPRGGRLGGSPGASRAHELLGTGAANWEDNSEDSAGFFRAVTPFGWTQAVKLALVDRGVLDSPLCRAPSRNLSPGERNALRRVFRDLAKREPRYFGGLVGD